MKTELIFWGAAGCVTGSCMELRAGATRILVDCGMFQGSKTLKSLNFRDFPFNPAEIDAVLLTHAHIDHSGLLPKLMLQGFEGPIYATAATRDLSAVMLADAGGIQEAEVRGLNRRNQQRGRPLVEPIYRERDIERLMPQFRRVKLGEPVTVAPDLVATFWEAGHILGSASIEVLAGSGESAVRTLFSGDIGGGGSEFLPDPSAPSGFDHIVLESTYGDRERPRVDAVARRAALAAEMREAHAAGGPLLLPAFALERSQELLCDLMAIMDEGAAPSADIFLDSPLAIEATEVFRQRGWNAAAGRNPFDDIRPSGRLRFLDRPADSDGLDRMAGWHVIMAGSGMCDAGRIRRHLKRLLWRKSTTVLLTGFQAVGTLGRLLAEGTSRVSIQGEEIQVRARIRHLDVYSAHADANALEAWAVARGPVRGSIFLDHGEPAAALALQQRLGARQAAGQILIPDLDDHFVLEAAEAKLADASSRRLPAEAAASLDWHNARAQFLIALNEALQNGDDAARAALIAKLQGTLERRARA
jgi:metallo-beta-lactamase family protein